VEGVAEGPSVDVASPVERGVAIAGVAEGTRVRVDVAVAIVVSVADGEGVGAGVSLRRHAAVGRAVGPELGGADAVTVAVAGDVGVAPGVPLGGMVPVTEGVG